jgi:hypothetical protein
MRYPLNNDIGEAFPNIILLRLSDMAELNIFVRILELGEKFGVSGINETEIKEWILSQPEVSCENSKEYQMTRRIFDESFETISRAYGNPNDLFLKNECYFRLIEFRELELSRKASSSANTYSRIAIGLSIAAIIGSVFVAYLQIITPTTISSNQLSEVNRVVEVARIENTKKLDEVYRELKDQKKIHKSVLSELQSLNKSMQSTAKTSAD